MLKGLKQLNQTTQSFDSARGQFNNLNLESIEMSLNLKDRATELGSKNLPSVDDETKDEIALTIDYHISHIIQTTKSQLSSLLQAGKKNIELKFRSDQTETEITMDENECASSLSKIAKLQLQKVFMQKRYLHRTEVEYDEFREKHRITGPAKFQTPKQKNLSISIIFFIFGLELFLNTFILGDAYPTGMLGVMIEVLLFSFINAALAILFGNFILREIQYKFLTRKIIFGVIAGTIVLLSIIILNLFFAHYRDAIAGLTKKGSLESGLLELGHSAMTGLISHPFELNDFKSYLLWLSGITIVLLSAFKVFRLDDPYPGYGRLQRSLDNMAELYTKECEIYTQKTNDVVNQFYNEYRNKAQLIKAKRESAIDWVEKHNGIIDKYNDWLNHLTMVGKALYKRYRTQMQLSRNDGGVLPKAFLHDFKLAGLDSDNESMNKIHITDYEHNNPHETIYQQAVSRLERKLELINTYLQDIENLGNDDPSLNATDLKTSAEAKVSELMKTFNK